MKVSLNVIAAFIVSVICFLLALFSLAALEGYMITVVFIIVATVWLSVFYSELQVERRRRAWIKEKEERMKKDKVKMTK